MYSSKIKYHIALTILVTTLFTAVSSIAQNIKATATINNNTIKIGEQVKLSLNITYTGKHINIAWPQITDTLSKEIEVVNQSAIDTIIADSANPYQLTQRKSLIITSFDSGTWYVPPFKFIIDNDSNGVFTQSLKLYVNNVAVDTTLAIKEIKPIFEVNYTVLDWIKDHVYEITGVLAALIIITLLIIYFIKKRKNKPVVVEPETPKLPAHIIAFEKLDKLKNEKLWQNGKIKQYYIALTDIVREYIENRYKIQALEQTTEEIIISFRNIAIDEESKAKLKQLLVLSDLVKFAKEHPLPSENELSLNNAYDFINGTKKEEDNSKPKIENSK